MAKQMNYVVPKTGAVCPESYWIPAMILIFKSTKTGRVTFYGYANAQARIDEKESIDEASYEITPIIYEEYFSPHSAQNIYAAAYLMAETCDNFFDNATNV